MTFSAEAWQRIAPLYEQILALPFNQELAAGTLSRERFTFYMLQDALYLTHFGKALAVTAARAPDGDALIQLAGSAKAAVLPVPVAAWPIRSRPSTSGAMASAWIGVGIV